MPSFYVTLGLLSLAGSALGHTRQNGRHGWRKGKSTGTGTGAPFPTGNSTGIWGTGTGTGYYPTATGTAPSFYESALSSVVLDAGAESTTTSTCTTSNTVYVTTTNTLTVTVEPEETASSVDVQARQETRTRRTRTRTRYGAPVPTTSAASSAVESAATSSAVVTSTLETVVASSAAPSSDSSSTTSSVSTPTVRAIGAGKRGLAYNNAALCAPFASSSLITWGYNWAQTSSGLDGKYNFVPMLWGTNSMFTNGWAAAASSFIANGGSHLLAFNEPDHAQQANMAPAVAAAAYKAHMQPFAGKAKLGSPAVTNGGGDMGLTWLSNFMSACSGCTIDFVAVHWYDSVNNVEYFKNHITSAHTKTGKPVWLTEFGTIDGSDAQKADFLRKVLPWLDAQDWIERYAYFMVSDGMMVNGGSMSAQGSAYAA
ncbi:hypothetical protein W97_03003 [Coniosporium apollinis CBS 100218]|uniref:Asl1-like glycosyl hydrolase catalytic domain-containing protein n=1 Tax=Coniosporium apollinis (strain CBS 100218) TaxID=1168221 RepID=R7YPB6_CONA1|nr:uncharacterized protein W97_03003 [Coniosporium apollinis CBS 100218]EON63775.1 hypothetical protein W97_03003 [Coniosporium apollinis CBS 100218]